MKCSNPKCEKEAEYRFDFEWYCWKCYLIQSSNQKHQELRLNQRDKMRK